MYLLGLSLVLLALKVFEVGPVADWSWWWVLLPFAGTALWWWFSDVSGRSRRKAMQHEEQRRADRINADRKRMGLPPLPPRSNQR